MARITEPLYWDTNNVNHLAQSHQVTPDEVEEVVFGCDGEEATYRLRRDGDYYKVFGETGGGRLLAMIGEFLENGQFRVFGARDMNDDERRIYRKGK